MTDEHPNADDWRNRCERAEQALAEMTEDRDLWRRSESACSEQYDKLSAKLAEQQAEIVAWLRGEVPSRFTDPQYALGITLADAIERGDYRTGGSDADNINSTGEEND